MQISLNCICCNSFRLRSSPAILMPFLSHRIFNWRPTLISKKWKLNTIKSGKAYSVCNSLLCMDCNLLFLDMRFDDQELDRLYYNYRDEKYANLRNKYEPGYKIINKIQNLPINYIKKVENFLSPFFTSSINILDFGGDDGKNTPFKDTKNIIHIYDISKKPSVKNLKKVNKSNMLKKYNLVILSQVIEHVSYPQLIINEIKKLLNKNSILYIELPLEKLMKKMWEFKKKRVRGGKKKELLMCLKNKTHWHEHINFYSKKSLVKLFNCCGLKIIKMNILPVEVYKSGEVIQIACKKI
jgi:hypothetical protein